MPSRTSAPQARLASVNVIGRKRRAQGAARIAGGRLDPDVVETCRRAAPLPLATQFNATPPARHRFFMPSLRGEAAGQPQDHFLQHSLDRGGKIHVFLRPAAIPDRAAARRTARGSAHSSSSARHSS